MNHAASTISCAAVPAVRATRAPRVSTCRWTTRLLRIFGGDRLKMIMEKLKMPEGEAIEHAMVNRSLESAQRKVEQRNFDIRKQLLEYDDVANDQRRVIYQQRNELLETDNISPTAFTGMRAQVLNETINNHIHPGSMAEEQWDIAGLETCAGRRILARTSDGQQWLEEDESLAEHGLRDRIVEAANQAYEAKVALVGADNMRQFERSMLLQSLDSHWREHLAAMDHLRQGIHLRGYAAKNPKQEYKREAFELFERMLDTIAREVTQVTLTVQIRSEADIEAVEPQENLANVRYHHADYDTALAADATPKRHRRTADRTPIRQSWTQRSLPLRFRQEIQALPRQAGLN
jgi:preprotein translocase subunit SecA